MKIRHSGGLSLLEAVITFAIFAVLSLMLFGFFKSSVDQFKVGTTRGDLQSQSGRIINRLRMELVRSADTTVLLESKQVTIDSVSVPRDRISFGTVSDWSDLANFRPNSGLPIWNEQLLFASDLETPIGHFGFARVNPTSSPPDEPWAIMTTLAVPITSHPEVVSWTHLSDSLHSLDIEKIDDRYTFDFVLKPRNLTDSKQSGEKLQLTFSLTPSNGL
jgi:hypothetical protein